MGAFGLKRFFSDLGCKLLLYIQRVGRSVSIATTCHLSVFQAVTVSPWNSRWKNFQVKAPKYIDCSICLCWILYMVVNVIFPVYVHFKGDFSNMTEKWDYEYSSSMGRDNLAEALYVALLVFPEVLFSMIIAWASVFMVVILYRYKQRVQNMHSSRVSHSSSPESRATRSILVLVFTFLAFYTLSSILQGCIAVFSNPTWWLVNITVVISMYFPTLTPFLLRSDSTVTRFCFSWTRNKNPHSLDTRM